MSEPAWKAANRAHWDELVAVHLSPRGYDLTSLREGRWRLNAIEEAELWPVDDQYILPFNVISAPAALSATIS